MIKSLCFKGVNISPDSGEKLTMRQLGLKREYVMDFLQILQMYNVVLPKEKAQHMTLAE